MTSWFAVGLVFISAIFGSYGALYLKKGSSGLHRNLLGLLTNFKLLFGICLYVVSSVFFITALRFGELSVLYPLTSITYIGVVSLSVWKLGERMNKFKILGICLIILGITLVRL
ncbi:MAG TPA: EamA family transporter [Candidatus Nanoarchaeia archaeon]|nr:EamA family transporter [Candidatus Nanoarchaeia archaeon]